MLDNIMQACCFVAIIALGHVLRRFGFFKEGDFTLLSRIVLKITLPAAIVSNFSGKTLDISLLAVALLAFVGNIIYVAVGYVAYKRRGKQEQAFGLLNLAGYNIGNFIIPFVQSFLGPTGVITASFLDVGNSFFSLGGAFSVAALVKDRKPLSLKRICKTLVKSVALDTYIVMTVLTLLNIRLPQMVVSFADVVGSANIFLGMLMLGVGLRIPNDKTQIGYIVKHLAMRYGLAAVLALAAYHLLPFALPVRQAAVMVLFAPIASAATAYTDELGCDVGLASAINSASVICSVVMMVILSTVML